MHDWILSHGNYHGYAMSTPLSFPMFGRMAWAGKNMDFRMITFCYMSVCLSSVTFVRPTQAIEVFRNVSIPFGAPVICCYP